MRVETGLASKAAKIKAVSAAGIENNIVGRWGQSLRNTAQQRGGHAEVVQPTPSGEGSRGVSRLLGPPVLRLK